MTTLEKRSAAIMFKAALLLTLSWSALCRADDSDPPGRVARLGYLKGQVSIEPAGLDDWAAADLNRPVTRGDKLWADADSRAELSIGSAVVRLGSATGFSFLNLDEHGAQMQVTAGTVGVHVRSMSDTLEVDTPNVAVALLGPGDYRVEVNDAGDATVVKVSGGTAEVTGGGQDFAVHPQQLATFAGTAEVSERVASLGAPDAFDTWAYERDRQMQDAQAWNYVSAEAIGAEDLDQNGTWQSTPDDGDVWSPNTVAVGWAPYRFGHWVWIAPWGWSWVDDAPWGYAPFHYGRWATFAGRWCWVPGPRRARPVYAPALVAWLGGPQFSSAAFAGAPGVAWFPLGPREVYVPAYPASQTYIRNINVTNTSVSSAYVTNVFNRTAPNVHYVNRNAPGAVTAVAQSAFTAAMPVARNAVRLEANVVASAAVSASAPAITPAKQSLLGAGASGPGIRHPPAAVQERVVLAKTLPPPPPVPFALQQQAIRANGGRPLARADLAALQILSPAAPLSRTATASGAAAAGSGIARAAARTLAAPGAHQAAVHSARAPDRPVTPPLSPAAAPAAPPAEPQSAEPEIKLRTDRPTAAVGRPAAEQAASRGDRPSAAAAQPALRLDRPPAQVKAAPAPAPYAPPVAEPEVRAERAPAPEPKPAGAAEHTAKPARPLERNRAINN